MNIPLLQTVAATNYLPFVLVLADSLREHVPDARLDVLITDASPAVLDRIRALYGDKADFSGCHDLSVPHMETMRSYYSVLEFNSACKVLALDHRIRVQNRAEALFIDPDMLVLGNFIKPTQAAGGDIALTLHTYGPYPQDHELPTETELAVTGQVNGGLIYVRNSEASQSAISWLARHTLHDWFVAPSYGMYADQQWLSFLPQFFPESTVLLRNAGINIAYWNLHERPLRGSSGQIVVQHDGEQPALLFHFSGFSLPSNGRLTRHSTRRFDPGSEETLAALIGRYEEKLLQAQALVSGAGVSGDLAFCKKPLDSRMHTAEQRWGVRFPEIAAPSGRFARLGRSLDKLFI